MHDFVVQTEKSSKALLPDWRKPESTSAPTFLSVVPSILSIKSDTDKILNQWLLYEYMGENQQGLPQVGKNLTSTLNKEGLEPWTWK